MNKFKKESNQTWKPYKYINTIKTTASNWIVKKKKTTSPLNKTTSFYVIIINFFWHYLSIYYVLINIYANEPGIMIDVYDKSCVFIPNEATRISLRTELEPKSLTFSIQENGEGNKQQD